MMLIFSRNFEIASLLVLFLAFVLEPVHASVVSITYPAERRSDLSFPFSFAQNAQPTSGNRFFVLQCEECFGMAVSQKCKEVFDECTQSGGSVQSGADSSATDLPTLTAKCAQTQILQTPNSIYCSGIEAVLNCQTSEKCRLLDPTMIVDIGTTVAVAHEVNEAFEETNRKHVKDHFDFSPPFFPSSSKKRTATAHGQVERQALDAAVASFEKVGASAISDCYQDVSLSIDSVTSSLEFLWSSSGGCSSGSSHIRFSVDKLGAKRSIISSKKIHKVSDGVCANNDSAAGRPPLPITITISGSRLSRKEVVNRAIKRLQARDDFKQLFSPKKTVKTVTRDDKKFRYIVQFNIFR